MATNYTFDEIKAKVTSRGSKSSKIDWMVKEAGFTPHDAEHTYRLILSLTEPVQRRCANETAIHFTMGVEIECINVNRDEVMRLCNERNIRVNNVYNYHHTNRNSAYELKRDGSLTSDAGDTYEPCEIVTPVLRNLNSLKTVCEIINLAGARVNRSCGLHVHFGASELTDAQWRRLVINYARLEDVINSFMPASRRDGCIWCRSMRNRLEELEAREHISRRDLSGLYRNYRRHKVNLESFWSHGTVEFRQHAGTTNFVKIENWVKFLAGLLTYSMQNETLITATTIDEIPFLKPAQKAYFKERATALAR